MPFARFRFEHTSIWGRSPGLTKLKSMTLFPIASTAASRIPSDLNLLPIKGTIARCARLVSTGTRSLVTCPRCSDPAVRRAWPIRSPSINQNLMQPPYEASRNSCSITGLVNPRDAPCRISLFRSMFRLPSQFNISTPTPWQLLRGFRTVCRFAKAKADSTSQELLMTEIGMFLANAKHSSLELESNRALGGLTIGIGRVAYRFSRRVASTPNVSNCRKALYRSSTGGSTRNWILEKLGSLVVSTGLNIKSPLPRALRTPLRSWQSRTTCVLSHRRLFTSAQ